jgi:hypothetical protein
MEMESMVRAISIFGLAGLFLAVSPPLRNQAMGFIASGVAAMEFYAPISYIVGVIVVLVSLVISFNRGSRAR